MNFRAAESLAEQIAQHVGQQIICGKLSPQARVQEQKIAQELTVSRGSVREALLILARRHLVDILPRRGAVVSQLTAYHVECVHDVYVPLITLFVQRVAVLASESDLNLIAGEIQSISKMIARNNPRPDEIIRGFEKLAWIGSRVNDNIYLHEILEDFHALIARIGYLGMQSRLGASGKTHEFLTALLEAVRCKNEAAVAQLIKAYAAWQRDRVVLAFNRG